MRNLSIIITSYNKLKQLQKVIKSIKVRLKEGDQIVIVDDGSSDGSQDYIKNLDLDVSYDYHLQEDKGYRVSTARNEGIQLAGNDCIVQIDDDYLMTGNIIEKARKLFDKDKFIIFRRDEMDDDGNIYRDERMGPKWDKGKVGANLLYFIGGNPLKVSRAVWGMMMYSKEAAKEVGLYNEVYNGRWGCEDADFGARFYCAGYDVLYYVGEKAVHLDHTKRENRFDEREENEELMKQLLREYKKKEKFQKYLGG